MSKQIIFPVISVLLAITIAAGVYFYLQNTKKTQETTSPVQVEKNMLTVSEKTKEYIDPAGFSFSYPESLTVTKYSDASIDTSNYYASLQVEHSQSEGKIYIFVYPSTKKEFDAKLPKQNTKMVKLADMEAVQYSMLDNSIATAAFDQGAAFEIKTLISKDTEFWKKINDQIVKSFALAPPEVESAPAATSDGSSEGDVEFEGEEVIE